MKSKFSKSFKSSTQPRKQRKYRLEAPNHIRRKFLSVNLSKSLRKKYNCRNMVIKKGDSVRIMRGEFKNKTGKVSKVSLKRLMVQISGVQRSKKGGEKLETWFRPSILQITELEDSDPKRFKNKKIEKTKDAPEKK